MTYHDIIKYVIIKLILTSLGPGQVNHLVGCNATAIVSGLLAFMVLLRSDFSQKMFSKWISFQLTLSNNKNACRVKNKYSHAHLQRIKRARIILCVHCIASFWVQPHDPLASWQYHFFGSAPSHLM